MHMNLRHKLALALLGLGITLQVRADTIYVDQRFGPGGTGTSNAPYNTIQAAINNGSAVVIIVYPGLYNESLNVNKSLTILGYDGPLTTRVSPTNGNAVTTAQNMTVTIQGLTLSSGTYGVYQPTAGTLYLRNCMFCGNTSHGIYLDTTGTATQPTVYVENCISVANGGSGLFVVMVDSSGYCYCARLRAYNNIFIGNQRYALESTRCDFHNGLVQGSFDLDYNDYVANVLGNYYCLFGPGMPVPIGSHSLQGVAPDFVGGSAYSCNQDYRLLPTSACRNAGQPGLAWLNPDGTRNDMGAYSGPGSATFYTNPNDGPIIRNVTIDQGMVPRGSTFTIRATGAVR
jgi:hypothetical protein